MKRAFERTEAFTVSPFSSYVPHCAMAEKVLVISLAIKRLGDDSPSASEGRCKRPR